MSLKIGLNLTRNYSINFTPQKRSKKLIKFIIIHYTGMKKESDAIQKLCDPKSKVSSHYFIKNNGALLSMVPDLYTAWHAGVSNWKSYSSLNNFSIGIEINNPGHKHGYKKFSKKQILSLIKLLRYLFKKYRIKKQNVLGHSDISPNRKKDPGEKFPWKQLGKKNLCAWHNLNENKSIKFRKIKLNKFDEKTFFKNLYKIGYSKKFNKLPNSKGSLIVRAFQRKFRPNLINGLVDKECLILSKRLVKHNNNT